MNQREKEEGPKPLLFYYVMFGVAILLISTFILLRSYLIAIIIALISSLCLLRQKFLTGEEEEKKGAKQKNVRRIGPFLTRLWPEPDTKSNSEEDKKF